VAAKSLAARGDGDTLMPHIRKWMVFGLLLTTPILLAETPSTHHKSKKHVKHVKPLVLPPLPSGALSQLPMDLIPAAPATVNYEDGLLSISAQNSTLWDILRDVRRLTGASIDMPAGQGMNERVIAHLGPGAPRDVLAGLLNGTSFNYVMLGSNTDPGAVTSLALSPKPLGPGEQPQVAAVYQNNTPQAPPPFQGNPQFRPGTMTIPRPDPNAQAAAPTEEETKDDAEENTDDNADDQAQPGQPEAGAAQQQPDPNQPNAGPKTPEQILEMLRRQQQMQPGATIPGQQPPQQ
jgi:hypothetical protein